MTKSLEDWRARRDARRADKSLTRTERYGEAARKRRNGFNGFKRKAWAKAYKARMDAGLETCRGCHRTSDLTWDHIIPISKGGTWAKTNMTILCWPCNRKKAWKDLKLQSLADEEATRGVPLKNHPGTSDEVRDLLAAKAAEWDAMTPAERRAELQAMDDHVSDVERRRAEGEAP